MENICLQIGGVLSGVRKDRSPELTNWTWVQMVCAVEDSTQTPLKTGANYLLSLCYRVTSSLDSSGSAASYSPLLRFSFYSRGQEKVSYLYLQRASPNLKKKIPSGKNIGTHLFQNLRIHFIKER